MDLETKPRSIGYDRVCLPCSFHVLADVRGVARLEDIMKTASKLGPRKLSVLFCLLATEARTKKANVGRLL
jgi:hypothetical protein